MSAPRAVVAYDASPAAAAAVAVTGRLLPGAEALVVAVADGLGAFAGAAARAALPDEVIATAAQRLREAALRTAGEDARDGAESAAAAGLRATAQVLEAEGAVLPALLKLAHESQAELVVCGTRGHRAVTRALLGSVATGLLHQSPIPVLIVPAPATGPASDGPVLLGHDGSDDADRTLMACARLLSGSGRELVVVRAWTSGLRHTLTGRALAALPLRELREIVASLDEEQAQRERQAVEEAARRALELGLNARARCEESADPASEVLLRVAEEERAAAIAVGRRGRGALSSSVLGSVSAGLTHAAERPVLVVP